MVRAFDGEHESSLRSKLHHFKGMLENGGGRHIKSFSADDTSAIEGEREEDAYTVISQTPENGESALKIEIGAKYEPPSATPPHIKHKDEMDLLKERFAKLLLGEDMSGGGKGVSSALALSNAITNLAASVFGEQSRLEPMSPETKARWRKEVDLLLCVTDHIVEFAPAKQKNKDGSVMEIMTTRQRTDLHTNIPALRNLDLMLIECLDNFEGQQEFYYVSKDAPASEKGTKRREEKWWLPSVKVPPNGLAENARKFIQYQKDCVNQVLKAAMAINAHVLSEMEIPENYIESLPKNGRSSLGDSIYKNITVDFFDPDQFLSAIDLTSEHKVLELKNKIEASMVIWRRKMNQKDSKSAWGSAVSLEKRELFEERAETILLMLKQYFPGTPQSALDVSKIQYNRDVGLACLEGYSRILESLAHTVMSRIEDVLYADKCARNPSLAGSKKSRPVRLLCREQINSDDEDDPTSQTNLMGWNSDQNNEAMKDAFRYTDNKTSYLERLGGSRSPTERH